jgi:DNA-binding NarL/FixJ family response regulator
VRVAIEASAESRERLVAALGTHADVVASDAADVVIRAADTAADALAAIASGFAPSTVLLVPDAHAELALAAIRAGASAVLPHVVDAGELLAAIAAVRSGLIVLDAAVRDDGARAVTRLRAPLSDPLTERERQVLAMLAGGRSNRRIADALGISENTVKAHVAAILAKLGATTRTEAVTAGVRLGLVML